MRYNETEMFEALRRMVRIYLESYPDDKEGLERFLKWAHTQFGYVYNGKT